MWIYCFGINSIFATVFNSAQMVFSTREVDSDHLAVHTSKLGNISTSSIWQSPRAHSTLLLQEFHIFSWCWMVTDSPRSSHLKFWTVTWRWEGFFGAGNRRSPWTFQFTTVGYASSVDMAALKCFWAFFRPFFALLQVVWS